MVAPMRILVFDSGLGGLTVHREIVAALPGAAFVYAADDSAFPYGAWAADDLVWRVVAVMRRLVADVRPDVVVVACNTASTLVLPHLRAAFAGIPFVGTVPAIKPAAEGTKSGLISVLATPGTVARDYTRDLVSSFAAHCSVELVGSTHLAALAEDFMHARPVPDADIAREIAPCFVARGDRRTDTVVLACTHYPLLMERLVRLAPWPVAWIDPARAIARRVAHVAGAQDAAGAALPAPGRALFTSGAAPDAALAAVLARFGLVAGPSFGAPVARGE